MTRISADTEHTHTRSYNREQMSGRESKRQIRGRKRATQVVPSVCDTKSVYRIEGKRATRNNAAMPFNGNTNMAKARETENEKRN